MATMLHWLAGQRAPDGASNDPDATNYIEPPETPAPVFAVRAFKHALFGTPQTTQQPNPRRNSNTENSRPRSSEARPTRPGLARPKSASDAQALGRVENQAPVEPLASPTKSILLPAGGTPGGGKKKNVTFGGLVDDGEEKRPLRSGLPEDYPGKFPSPGHELGKEVEVEEDEGKSKGRNKLNERFEEVREEGKKRRTKEGRKKREAEIEVGGDEEEEAVPLDFRDPKSESGKYWKSQYDMYRTNTQREVKKLLTKQRAAKSYALSKDMQCTELADQLRQEQKKVEELGSRTEELTEQMKEMGEMLKSAQDAERAQREELETLKRQLGRRDSARPGSSDGSKIEPATRELEQSKPQSYIRVSREVPKPADDPVQRPSEPYKHPSPEREKPRMDIQSLRAKMQSRQKAQPQSQPQSQQSRPADDIWAEAFGSSSPLLTRSAEKGPPSPSSKASRPVTNGTDVAPLKSLDINTLSAKEGRRTSSLGSMEVECKSTPDLDRVDSKSSSHGTEEKRQDSPLQSPSIPLPSASDLLSTGSAAVKQEPAPRPGPEERGDDCIRFNTSSPFQEHARSKTLPPVPPRHGNGLSGPREAQAPKPPPHGTSASTNHKENQPPSSKPHTPHADIREKGYASLSERPSAVWGALSAAQASSNPSTASRKAMSSSTGMTGKDGREVSGERLEAAKARIAARKATN